MPEPEFFIIKAGSTFDDLIAQKGDFQDWIRAGLGLAQVRIINAEKGETLPPPETVRAAVISGAHSMVTQNLPWSLALEAWTREIIAADIPLLGICYGHQIMGRALGGDVAFNPRGTEIGTREIRCLSAIHDDPLFQGLPERFKVHVFHSQSVIRLPEAAVLLAGNDVEPHQAFRIGNQAWGVQFHPEADAEVTRGYIRNLAQPLTEEGQDLAGLYATLEETPHAAALLRRFAVLVNGG